MKCLSAMVMFCGLMGIGFPVLASTYYVSPTGNDSSDGSAATPWKTIQHAADKVSAGDSVIIRSGTYAGFVLGWDYAQNGTISHPITFQADPGAVINKRNNKTPDGINLEGTSYIRVEGFTIQNGDGSITRAGIRSVTNTDVTIRDNQIDGMGTWGIFTGFSENILLENNDTSRSTSQHGIYVSNSADNPTIRGNRSWGNNQCGIHMNGDLSQGGDGIISGALIEGNMIHDNGRSGGSGINCDGVQSSMIRNNLLYSNHASGISLYAIDGAEGSKNNSVINNTIIEAGDARWAINIKDGSTGNTVLNNILFNNHPSRGSINIAADSLPGFISDYNIVENRFSPNDGDSILSLSQWQTQTGQDKHSITATQTVIFVSAGTNDYHLSATSPAIDKGTSVPDVSLDIDGSPRPRGLTWDIGAYEYAYVPSCDFNGDGKTDIVIYRKSSGWWFIKPSGGSPYGVGWGGDPSDTPVAGDYDGDGKTDVAVYRGDTGVWWITPSSSAVAYPVGWGGPGYKPVPGDYDGDGKTDIAIYEVGTGVWWIIPSSGAPAYGVGWGGSGFKPVPGDYDGDGKTDVAIYGLITGVWWIIPSSGAPAYGVGWGGTGFTPLPADYDGDGKTDIAIFETGTGVWWMIPSSGAPAYGVGWGGPAYTPVPGDYDGDGKTDIAIYEAGTGAWWMVPSSGAPAYGVGWGGDPNDVPITMNLP